MTVATLRPHGLSGARMTGALAAAGAVSWGDIVNMFREDEPGFYHPTEPGEIRIGKHRRHDG